MITLDAAYQKLEPAVARRLIAQILTITAGRRVSLDKALMSPELCAAWENCAVMVTVRVPSSDMPMPKVTKTFAGMPLEIVPQLDKKRIEFRDADNNPVAEIVNIEGAAQAPQGVQ